MKKMAFCLLLFVLIPAPAFAANQGFYTYADLDAVYFNNSPVSSSDGLHISGGYQFNSYLGVEAGMSIVSGFPPSNNSIRFSPYTDESLNASTYQVAVVGTFPFDDHQGLFGKVGWASTSLDYKYSYYGIQTVTGSGNATKTNPMFGIGWQSMFYRNISWHVRYENFGKIRMITTYSNRTSNSYDVEVNVLSLGLGYNF